MPVKIQNALFKYFTDTLNHIVQQVKKTGRFDMGILGKFNFFLDVEFEILCEIATYFFFKIMK